MIKIFSIVFWCTLVGISFQLPAQPKYEFRGVWVATVDNIDWPSSKYLSSDSQKAEFMQLLDMHRRNGMNAIIGQVRPATDAFYPSQYEPWSEWLTGTQGKPPIPYYDPLQFMITETHKRGMEFHAWLNPYRAEFKIGGSPVSPTHITRLHPDWFLVYGDKRYFDPGNKEVQKFVTAVVTDIVSRYDVDAIHFDDYFYPYRIAGKEFGDDITFAKYGRGMTRDDWRRSNVDSIILMLSKAIKKENSLCKFGISPFGVWRNNNKDSTGSNTRAGQTNYDDLYADILLWLKMKWIDYVAPQLYWELSHKIVGFGTLIDWWANHAYGRHLYIGQGIYRALEPTSYAWKIDGELPSQINKIREYPQVQGSVFFSSKTFFRNPNGWNDSLREHYYKYQALVPPMPWLDVTKPGRPAISYDSSVRNTFDSMIRIRITNVQRGLINKYVVYGFADFSQVYVSDPKNIKAIISSEQPFIDVALTSLPAQQTRLIIGITAATKNNIESSLSRYIYLEKKASGWQVIFDPKNE
ncbi:MAG: family 10 glycosylhydrolase [Ginsengibacter sp.]